MKKMIFLISINIFISSIAYGSLVKAKNTFRVVGGQAAVENDSPFVVSIQSHIIGHFCGGSLISADTVLTAAHCLAGPFTADKVIVGKLNLSEIDKTSSYKVQDVMLHPLYDFIGTSYDFAIIRLEDEVKVLRQQDFPVVANKSMLRDRILTVVGWGNTAEDGDMSTDLLKIMVPEVPRDICNKQFQEFFQSSEDYIDETMICAGYEQGGIDACQGDSGGPLYYKNNEGAFVLSGVVSWGKGCAREGLSGVYSNVAYVSDWISDFIH